MVKLSTTEQRAIILKILNNKRINKDKWDIFFRIAIAHKLFTKDAERLKFLGRFKSSHVTDTGEILQSKYLTDAHNKLKEKLESLLNQSKYTNEQKNHIRKILDNAVKNINLYVNRHLISNRIQPGTRLKEDFNRKLQGMPKLNIALQEFLNNPNAFLGQHQNQNSNFINELLVLLSMHNAVSINNNNTYKINTNKIKNNNIKIEIKKLILNHYSRLKLNTPSTKLLNPNPPNATVR